MSSLKLLGQDGRLPTRSATVPAIAMQQLRTDEKARLHYYQQFIATWFLSYERLSVPAAQRFEMKEHTCESELVPKANRLIEKYPGIGRDVIWEAWDLGLENYFVDNGKNAFPIFNFGVLILFINKYRHKAMLNLHPDLVAEQPKSLPSSEPTMRELLQAIRKMPDEQLELMLELQSDGYQPLFLHLAKKMTAENPVRYEALRSEAKRLWVAKVAARLGVNADTLVRVETKEILSKWEARFKKDGVMAIEDTPPSLYTDWRRLLLIDAEVYV